jgi:AcrR family transcriptional regulator
MREKKIDKRKAQGAETKKKLYDIGERLFSERNFSDVNVEDITDEAGITKGAFYVHFESKDALIAILIADHAVKADANYKSFLESLPDDMPSSLVLLALAGKIADTLANTFGCKNMAKIYQMLLSETAGTEAVKGYGRELYALVYSILEKGLHRGEFTSSLQLEALSRHFVMAIRGVSYEWCVRYPDFDLREQTIEHVRILLEGICFHANSND